MTSAGKKMLPITADITGIGCDAVKTTADFDSSMSQISAISGATGEDLEALRDKAREVGSKTKLSVSETADAMSYMTMTGWKTEDICYSPKNCRRYKIGKTQGESLSRFRFNL